MVKSKITILKIALTKNDYFRILEKVSDLKEKGIWEIYEKSMLLGWREEKEIITQK